MNLVNYFIEVTLTWPHHAPSVPNPELIYQSFTAAHVYRTKPDPASVFALTLQYESQPQTVILEIHRTYETAPQIFGTQTFKQTFNRIPSEQAILRLLQQGEPISRTNTDTIPAPHPLHSLPDELPTDRPTPMPEDFPQEQTHEILSTDYRDHQPEA